MMAQSYMGYAGNHDLEVVASQLAHA